jgi:hypothetical protein
MQRPARDGVMGRAERHALAFLVDERRAVAPDRGQLIPPAVHVRQLQQMKDSLFLARQAVWAFVIILVLFYLLLFHGPSFLSKESFVLPAMDVRIPFPQDLLKQASKGWSVCVGIVILLSILGDLLWVRVHRFCSTAAVFFLVCLSALCLFMILYKNPECAQNGAGIS